MSVSKVDDFDKGLFVQNESLLLRFVSAELIFKIDQTAVHRIGDLHNEYVEQGVVPDEINWSPIQIKKFNKCPGDLLDNIVYPEKMIKLKSFGNLKTFNSNTENGFTARYLLDCILNLERETRLNTRWLGGVDIHHRFFEGLLPSNGYWYVCWGS